MRKQRRRSASLFFCYTDSTIPLLPKSKFQAPSRPVVVQPVCVGPGRKPERWFSRDVAHLYIWISVTMMIIFQAGTSSH